MQFYPADTLKKLEFDRVLERLSAYAVSTLGEDAIRAIQPSSDLELVQEENEWIAEYLASIDKSEDIPVAGFPGCSKHFDRLAIEDYVFTAEDLLELRILLEGHHLLEVYFSDAKRSARYQRTASKVLSISVNPVLLADFRNTFDEEGNIRPTASDALKKVHRKIESKRRELDQVFAKFIQKFRKQGYLTENLESYRNGRRVLSVFAEHKRKIKGIIHDESTSGRTVFIEPEQVVEINNDLVDLDAERRKEIHKILAGLSGMLRPEAENLVAIQALMTELDVIQSKSRFSRQYDGVIPRLQQESCWQIRNGKHPLLFLKYKEEGKVTVPFDLHIRDSDRIVLVSGPNAGGKSVFMKAVGLLQLMVQSAIPVPVADDSEFGIFEKIFADIGDQQSLENDLSTYSSHLNNLKHFLEHADRHTLILLDEFGSGTDPQFGGALAESILIVLNQLGSRGVVTTHYSNLKVLASKTSGLVNGAMHFDSEHMEPTFRFVPGKPGSSYAFEIARRSGLEEKVIEEAGKVVGVKDNQVDKLLIELQREKKELEAKLKEVSGREKHLNHLIRNYDQLQRDLDYRRKKLRLEKKEMQIRDKAKELKEMEQVIAELKAHKDLEKARKLAAKASSDRRGLTEEIRTIRDEIARFEEVDPGQFREGMFVRIRNSETAGEIDKIRRDQATLIVGNMKVQVPLRDLLPSKSPIDVNAHRSITTDTLADASTFSNNLDIRGMRRNEADKLLDTFIDQAILSNSSRIQILHGKGNGILRKLVRKKLEAHREVKSIESPQDEQGGEGMTIATF